MKICAATNSPTLATSEPTLNPSSPPTPRPTRAPVPPTKFPTQSPTIKQYCKRDSKFPGRELSPYYTRTLAMSSNGNIVLYVEEIYENEYESDAYASDTTYGWGNLTTTVWITTKNGNNGKWVPKQVAAYLEYPNTIQGAISNDGTHVVLYLNFGNMEQPENITSEQQQIAFIKLMANGEYKILNTFFVEPGFVDPGSVAFWVSPNGDKAIASYTGYIMPAMNPFKATNTFVREKNAWSLQTTQEGVVVQSFSRDGKMAVNGKTIYELKNKQWIVQTAEMVGHDETDPVEPQFQGARGSSFSASGKAFVMSTARSPVHSPYVYGLGAFVFTRSNNGTWVQQGPKLGEFGVGAYTAISNDLKTIVLSRFLDDRNDRGFEVYKKNGKTWKLAGDFSVPGANLGMLLNAKGDRVLTVAEPSVWEC